MQYCGHGVSETEYQVCDGEVLLDEVRRYIRKN